MDTFKGIIIVLGLLGGLCAHANSLRITQVTPEIWSKFEKGEIETLEIEFRQGDNLPLAVQMEGDFLESNQNQSTTVVMVKRDFYLKLKTNSILMSLDGIDYKPFKDLVKGSATVGFSSDQNGGIANAMNATFAAFLK